MKSCPYGRVLVNEIIENATEYSQEKIGNLECWIRFQAILRTLVEHAESHGCGYR